MTPPDEMALPRARMTELAAENVRLLEAAAARDELAAAQLAPRHARIAALAAQVEGLTAALTRDRVTAPFMLSPALKA